MKKTNTNPMTIKWEFILDKPDPDEDPIGCVYAGKKIVAYHVRPEIGKHIAALHNKTIDGNKS